MTIKIQPRIVSVLLKHIRDTEESHDEAVLKPAIENDLGTSITEQDFLGHLDYLNQNKFIKADFSGDPYGDRGPNPLPKVILLKDAQITGSGESLLKKLEEEMQKISAQSSSISPENMTFLEKVMNRANLPDIFDARDITEVVFRTMRDLMKQDLVDEVTEKLHQPASSHEKSIHEEVADLWADTNPIVQLISQVRAPLNIDANLFRRRVREEGGLPRHINVDTLLSAVFSVTKESLSDSQIAEISSSFPDDIQVIWQNA